MRRTPWNLTRRQFLHGLAGASAATLAGRLALGEQPALARRPNVIVILADDLGYGDLGCYGGELPTPHIDAMAARALRFTDAYVSAPVCSPSRAGLLTGRYQQRFGHEHNPGPVTPENRDTFGLPLTERTMADRLRAAGYATGIVGKWHLGVADRFHPLERGFDECYAFLEGWHFYTDLDRDHRIVYRNREAIREEADYLTDVLTREGEAFIERHRDEPFFLYLSYNAVHTPLEATDRYLARFPGIEDPKRRTFAAMLSALDDGVGRVLAKLEDLGLARDTLVVFLSDNGGPTAVTTASNAPLRGGKAELLEGGIRIPWIVQWPGRVAPGVCDAPVIALDLLPTALSAAGTALPAEPPLDGADLVPLLTGREARPPHEALFWRIGPRAAARRGQWKLVRDGGAPWALFDLAGDVGETRDLAAERPAMVGELVAAHREWESSLARS